MTTSHSTLVELTANELRHRIGTREVSPVELLDACIERIEAVNPHVNAITATCYDRARTEAKAVEQAVLRGEPLALSPREHAVLRVLVQRSGEPFSKQQSLDRVFSDDEDVHPEAVEVFVHRLRKRLEGSDVRITTLRGLGYALECS